MLAASYVENRIPDWNESRRRNIVSAATGEFHQLFKQHDDRFQRTASDFEQFEKAVKAKSYRRYEDPANSLHNDLKGLRKEACCLFVTCPPCLSDLEAHFGELKAEVESDLEAVCVYAPDVMVQLEFLRARGAEGNVLDCYWAAKRFEQVLSTIRGRTSPFNFAKALSYLTNQAQAVRDQVLSGLAPSGETTS